MALAKKVAILDIESVLVDAEFLPLLAERVGNGELVREITLRGIRGETQWEEGLRQRIDALKGAEREDATEVANSMPYMEGALEFCGELKRKGYVLIGVTGGFALLAERVKRELGLDHVFSNELIFNDGMLTSVRPLMVTSQEVDGLEQTLRRMGAKKENTVAVVDGANDMKLFKYAMLKIAFNAQPIVKGRADIVVDIKDLRKLLPYF